jgi:uncharacterized membrane protein YccC
VTIAGRYERLLVEELRRRPARVRTALRMAVIGATGATLMAALRIESPLGPVLVWVALYASNARLTPSTGLQLIVAYGVSLFASYVIAGMLIDAPWLLLAVFGLSTAGLTYGMSTRGFVGPWLQVEIGFLDTFYIQAVTPQNVGWAVAHNFAGSALAVVVLVAFDMILWPDPAQWKLLRSLAHTLDRERGDLTAIVREYIDPVGGRPLPPSSTSIVPAQLPLLERARRELRAPEMEALLLAALTNTERLHIDVQRLLVTAREDVSRAPRTPVRARIEAVLHALVAAMQERAEHAIQRRRPLEPLRDETVTAVQSSLDALEASEIPTGDAAAIANLASFTSTLRNMGDRLLAPPLFFRPGKPRLFHDVTPAALARATARVHSVKVAVAATLAYVVCLASQRADLGVVVWTAIIAGLPTYSATLRRSFLRLVGAALGGLAALIVVIAVSPNFESASAYALAFFCVLFVLAYVGLSGPRLAYAGQQGALTFIIMYYGLSPNTDITEPLWRMWGVLLGLVIVSAVFLLVKPGYAANAIPPRLARLFHLALDLLRPGAAWTRIQIREINSLAILQLTQLLAVADDARLEGRRHRGMDPDRLIEAAGTLLRIIDRLCVLAVARLTTPRLAVPAGLETAITALATGLREHLQRRLDVVEHHAAPVPAADLAALRAALHEQLSPPVLAELATWPERARGVLLAEIESYRRTAELVIALDGQLSPR